MSFVAAAVAAVTVAATTYGAVSASENADKTRKSLDLNSAAGRKTAEELARIQHDDTIRQLNDQVNEFKAKRILAVQSEADKTSFDNKLLIVGAGLGAWLLWKKK